jgi:adenylate cyclase
VIVNGGISLHDCSAHEGSMLNASWLSLVANGAAVGNTPAATGHETDTAEQVRTELNRILNSAQFDASERNRRFLEYVIEETLAGRGERIKAYSIATIVFGRDDSFDPALDPVVRMEARRLRRSLERFYLVEGEAENVRITLPKGGYVPKFQSPTAFRSFAEHPTWRGGVFARANRGPSILVSPFNLQSESPAQAGYVDGLVRQVVVGLTRFPEFSIFMQVQPTHSDCGSTEWASPTDFILAGDAVTAPGVLKVKATLVHAQSGKVVWAQTLVGDTRTDSPLDARDNVADRIARALWESITALDDLDRYLVTVGCFDVARFESLVHFTRYRRSPRLDLYLAARGALETVLSADPAYAEGLACLSQIESDGHRFEFGAAESHELKRRAVELALKAVELAPDSSRAHHALGIAQWFSDHPDAGVASLKKAVGLNPNAVDAVADLGLHFCLLGDWNAGVPLIQEAVSKGPLDVGVQRVGLAFNHFLNGDFERAYEEARQVRGNHQTPGLVARAISLTRLGRRAEAADLVTRILGLDPRYGCHVLHEFGESSVEPTLGSEVRAALRDAGLALEAAQS